MIRPWASRSDSDVVAPDLGRNHAEEMQRIGMIRLQRERLAIERFGLREPAALMMRKAGGKKPGNPGIRRGDAGSLPGCLGRAAQFAVHVLVPRDRSREAPIAPRGDTH